MPVERRNSLVIKLPRMSTELFCAFFICSGYIIKIFNSVIRFFISDTHKIDTIFSYIVLLLLFLAVAKEIIRRIRSWQIAFIIIETIFLLISYIRSSDPATNISVMKVILYPCIPYFVIGGCIRDYNKFNSYLLKIVTVIPFVYAVLFVFFNIGALAADEGYAQGRSYFFLLPAVCLTKSLFDGFSPKRLIALCISLLFMFSYGARGPVACWGLSVVIYLILNINKNNIKKSVLIILTVCVVGITVLVYYVPILLWCRTVFLNIGLSTRTIDTLLNGVFLSYVGGRDRIADVCFMRIKDNPFIGTGPINDRIYITNALLNGESAIGNYPHNFFLELLMQYGVFLGGLLIIAFAVLVIRAIRRSSDRSIRDLVIIALGAYFFPLIFSASYIDSEGFYFLITVAITALLQARTACRSLTGTGEKWGN